MRKILSLLLLIICLFLGYSFFLNQPYFEDLNEQKISLSTLKNKCIFIHYWATWCETCVNEIPILNDFQRRHPNIVLFAVNYDGVSIKEQKELSKKFHLQYLSIQDPQKRLKLPDITGVPVTFVINHKGEPKKTYLGEVDLERILSSSHSMIRVC